LAIEKIGVVKTTLGDEPDVTRHVGVGGTSPLAVDDAVKVTGIEIIRWFHHFPPDSGH
jgi:hypothetical protein